MQRRIPDSLQSAARAVRDQGGKVYLSVAAGEEHRCANCNGTGMLMLQTVVGGLFDAVPSRAGNERAIIYEQRKWYIVRTDQYRCPVCRIDAQSIQQEIHL